MHIIIESQTLLQVKKVMTSYNSGSFALELSEESNFILAKYLSIVQTSYINASLRTVLLYSYKYEVLVCELNDHFDSTLVEISLHYSVLSEEIEEYILHIFLFKYLVPGSSYQFMYVLCSSDILSAHFFSVYLWLFINPVKRIVRIALRIFSGQFRNSSSDFFIVL